VVSVNEASGCLLLKGGTIVVFLSMPEYYDHLNNICINKTKVEPKIGARVRITSLQFQANLKRRKVD
jgi:hypothetical protein